jgi:hypothetical protein
MYSNRRYPEMRALLHRLATRNGDTYPFSHNLASSAQNYFKQSHVASCPAGDEMLCGSMGSDLPTRRTAEASRRVVRSALAAAVRIRNASFPRTACRSEWRAYVWTRFRRINKVAGRSDQPLLNGTINRDLTGNVDRKCGNDAHQGDSK